MAVGHDNIEITYSYLLKTITFSILETLITVKVEYNTTQLNHIIILCHH